MEANFPAALAFIWGTGRDNPADGFHVSPHDPGLGTKGGVIQATWDAAVVAGIVHGTLQAATNAQLAQILRIKFWGPVCDALAPGVDLLVFNGRVMTGRYPVLLQQGLGFFDGDADGWLGPISMESAANADPDTLIDAVSGSHHAYLSGLPVWKDFGVGWTNRLTAAKAAAHALAAAAALTTNPPSGAAA